MHEALNDTTRVITFENMHQYAHEEGVSSPDKMALIITTDMGFNHCYRSDARQHYEISNDTSAPPEAIRLR